jgi:hypothetical protein
MRLRHANLLNTAHFLQTESEPHLVRNKAFDGCDLNIAHTETVLQALGD